MRMHCEWLCVGSGENDAWFVLAFGREGMRIILNVGLCWLHNMGTNGSGFGIPNDALAEGWV